MKHALERLNHLIDVDINPLKNNIPDLTQLQLEHWNQQALKEKEYILRHLLRKSLKMTDEKALELFIQQHQSEIILLLDKVFIFKTQFPNSKYSLLFDELLVPLEELLNHIEQRYNKYFNQEQKVPDCYLNLIQQEMSKEIKGLSKFLMKSMNNQLANIILKPIKSFIKTKNGSISYKQLIYIKTLVKEIAQIHVIESISIDTITQALIYLNFNSASFINFAIERIGLELNNGKNDKVELLTDQLKKINLLVMKPGVALYQHKPSTKERIQSWLLEEINFIQVQQSIFIRPAPIEKDSEDLKINTSLSVQQLALWIRAAKDTGMIINKNHTALLKTMARIFTTPHSESISAESLRIKSYANEKSAQNALKDLLMKMYKQVHNYVLIAVLVQTIY